MFIFAKKTVQKAPWNKGKLTGQKPPLLPKHVWAIRTKLHIDERIRDLALFNLAIDSKLRGPCFGTQRPSIYSMLLPRFAGRSAD